MGVQKARTEKFIPSAVYTASFQTTANDMAQQYDDLIIQVVCTAATGGGTVTVSYQVSLDGGTTWTTVDSVAAVNAAGSALKRINAPIGQKFRLDAAIAGTNITFEVWIEFSRRS